MVSSCWMVALLFICADSCDANADVSRESKVADIIYLSHVDPKSTSSLAKGILTKCSGISAQQFVQHMDLTFVDGRAQKN